MLYAILCYNDEKAVGDWSKDQDDLVMQRLGAVEATLAAEGRLGPVARLQPTAKAVTLRKTGGEPLIVDGPFAETREQFLGFYVVDCADLDAALATARQLAEANPGTGAYEVRPLQLLRGGLQGGMTAV
jgi:hypothetical protein